MSKAKIWGTNYDKLVEELTPLRENGKKVIMCSGTFDLFHIGHMRMLAVAKSKGDILIVAVKSDRAAALKKEEPPVLKEDLRMETIANCISADHVVMVDYEPLRPVSVEFENTASFQWLNMMLPVVEAIKPDIFIHENNPSIQKAREELFSLYNVKSIIHPRTEGISTTEIIDKIKTRLLREMQ